ncbi:hypothetical protein [Flavobacterium sp.]|uniref:hypothetical protein n=1 Tax=Flavobacterium sp. TaxID=239 RepID=UPI0031D9CE28
MKNNKFFLVILLITAVYFCYKIFNFIILDSRITYDKNTPALKLSNFINISEHRITYNQSTYIDNKFVGFNALIDKNHFVTLTKLGKISSDFKLIKVNNRPDNKNNSNIIGFTPSDGREKGARYLDLSSYPFSTSKNLYYYLNGEIINVNKSGFYEIEIISSLFNINSSNKKTGDFGYIMSKSRSSISFINKNGNLFLINVYPIENAKYESLHSLLKI